MVCLSTFAATAVFSVNIKKYILEKYTSPKLSEAIYIVSYEDQSKQLESTKHAQLQCPQVIWPFARAGATPLEVPLKAALVLAEGDDETRLKCIMEILVEMPFAAVTSEPGDTIAILPFNDKADVKTLLQRMQLTSKANNTFQLQVSSKCTKKAAKLPIYIPRFCTPLQLLRDCLNLHAVPKKQFINALANCCTDSDERAFLSCLSSKDGSEYYNELILERGFKLFELLELCPSCKPKLEILIEHLPRLLPRPYSIANSPQYKDIKIIFSVLPEKPGITTKMLKSLATSVLNAATPIELPKIFIYPREVNKFRYTAQEANENNQILIGVGTALAPFLGFLELKKKLLASCVYKSLGVTWLFAGAVNEKYLLNRDRLLALEGSDVLQRYFECLSRVPSAPHHYVQEQLLMHAGEFIEFLMQDKTVLYVCADGGLISKSIEKAIVECLMQVQQITQDEAFQMIKMFRVSSKYREDLWT